MRSSGSTPNTGKRSPGKRHARPGSGWPTCTPSRHHAAAGQWQAVLDVDAELTRLDPSSSDPDGLATLARATLAAEQRAADLERRYAQARVAEDSGNWAAAARGYEEILRIDPE